MTSRRVRPLTDFAVIHAKPKAEGYEISDGGQRGLRLAVQPSGAKSWVVRFRHPVSGKSRKMTLPPGLSLAAARKFAGDALFLVATGIDPIDQKRVEREAAAAAVEGTLASVVTRYLDLAAPKRSRELYQRTLARVSSYLGDDKQVTSLKRSQIVVMLDAIERESGPRAADMGLAVLRSMLRWHQKRSDSFVSPIVPGMARVKASERVRTHLPSDDEVKAIWNAAGDDRVGVYGQVVRFMLLSGSRRSEAAGLRRSEIRTDNETGLTVWRLPPSRSKNKQPVTRPLSKAALQIIEDMPIISDSDFVFTLNGVRPMSMNYQDRKALLDKISGVTGWILHDTRRVFRSMLSRLRVPFETSEALLGHSRPVLVRTYDQHHPLVEMLEAVEKVAAEIARIVEGSAGRAHLKRIV
jgi:integrase